MFVWYNTNLFNKMKKLKLFKAVLILALVAFVSFSCDDNDNTIPTPQALNIVELAQDTPTLSELVSALETADGNLTELLTSTGPFTVLAPTNEAITAFLAENNFASLNDVPTDVLKQLLLNHVIDGKVMATDLTGSGYALTQARGPKSHFINIFYETTDTTKFNGTAKVTEADIEASNGIIHIVDQVIDIPTISTFLKADSNFSTALEALSLNNGANLNFAEILDLTQQTILTEGAPIIIRNNTGKDNPIATITPPFTVFAPANDPSFSLTNFPDYAIVESSAWHISQTVNMRISDIELDANGVGNQFVETLYFGQFLNITLPGTENHIANVSFGDYGGAPIKPVKQESRIAGSVGITKEIQAGNGVIHVITEYLGFGDL